MIEEFIKSISIWLSDDFPDYEERGIVDRDIEYWLDELKKWKERLRNEQRRNIK